MGRTSPDLPKKQSRLTRTELLSLTKKSVDEEMKKKKAKDAACEKAEKDLETFYKTALDEIIDYSDYNSTLATIETMMKEHRQNGKDYNSFRIDMAWPRDRYALKKASKPFFNVNSYWCDNTPLAKVYALMQERFAKVSEMLPETTTPLRSVYLSPSFEKKCMQQVIEGIAVRWNIEHPDLKLHAGIVNVRLVLQIRE